MKQVRFTSVVEQSGKPEVYLLLIDPKKDDHFQHALKANRVMTLQRGGTGGKTDFGTLGYSPGPRAQVLLFPRALQIPADAHVVGINYDLLDEEREAVRDEPKKKADPQPKPKLMPAPPPDPEPRPKPAAAKPKEKVARKSPSKTASSPEHQSELDLPREKPRPPAKVIPFSGHEPGEDEGKDDSVAKMKAEVRRALKALEAGKQVVAFNILKKILE